MHRARAALFAAATLIGALTRAGSELVAIPRETPETLTEARFQQYVDSSTPFILTHPPNPNASYPNADSSRWRSVRLWNPEYITERWYFMVPLASLRVGIASRRQTG